VSDGLEIDTELAGSASALSPWLELQGLVGRSLTTEAGRHLTPAKLVVEYAFH
jgi:hypothetical protein